MKSLLLVTLFSRLVISQVCYYPDGKETPGAYRCDNSTTGHSTCCEIGSQCWSNGVCQKQTDGITDWIRLGCTDPTWQDEACAQMCIANNTFSAIGVRPCDGISGTRYCCDYVVNDAGNLTCCDTESNIFTYRSATVEATIPLVYDAATATRATSSTSPTSSSSTITNVAATTTSAAAASSSTAASSSSSGLSSGAKAGVGVGVGLAGLAGLAALAFFLLRRRRNATGAITGAAGTVDPGYGSQYPPQYIPVYNDKAGVAGSGIYKDQPHQQYQHYPSEMDTATQMPAEIDSSNMVHELGDTGTSYYGAQKR